MEALKRLGFPPTLCLVCGVDSGPIRIFLLLFIGSLVLASLCVLAWGLSTKRVDGDEKIAEAPLEAEKRRTP